MSSRRLWGYLKFLYVYIAEDFALSACQDSQKSLSLSSPVVGFSNTLSIFKSVSTYPIV